MSCGGGFVCVTGPFAEFLAHRRDSRIGVTQRLVGVTAAFAVF